MSDLLDDLQARGLIHDVTDAADLAARLAAEPVSLYYGCDPTADSLHIGNLIGLLILRRFQDAGHRPVALVGGATGMIGDPGGRSEERNLLDAETLAANVAAITAQVERILGEEGRWVLVDNASWTWDVRLLDFLRDIGKHVTVNQMIARESVKQRLAGEHGISFTEFSYMLLQAHDYLWLHDHEGCVLQIGGSDQWGNILSGIDLIRRVRGVMAHGLCWPLLTSAAGTKIGKSTGASVWLDPQRTSPYQFWQHWMQVPDDDLRRQLAVVHPASAGRDRRHRGRARAGAGAARRPASPRPGGHHPGAWRRGGRSSRGGGGDPVRLRLDRRGQRRRPGGGGTRRCPGPAWRRESRSARVWTWLRRWCAPGWPPPRATPGVSWSRAPSQSTACGPESGGSWARPTCSTSGGCSCARAGAPGPLLDVTEGTNPAGKGS